MKKSVAISAHVRKRAKQRYSTDLTRGQMDDLAGQILSGRAIHRATNGTVSTWLVLPEWSDEPVPVIFCERRQRVVTILPRNYAERKGLVEKQVVHGLSG